MLPSSTAMNKSLTILLITLLCSCYSYAQLPVIPVPVPNAMDTYGTNINFPSSPGPSAPFTPSKQQNNIYDPNELIRRRQRAQQEIEEATAMMREIEECYSIASSLTKNGFPISDMLHDSITLNLERAIFLIENAYLNNQLNFNDFQKSISEKADYCKWRMRELKLNPHDGLVQNMAIFSLLTDTLNVRQLGNIKENITGSL